MLIVVKNALTGNIIGVAHSATEALNIAEKAEQPYRFEVHERR